MTPLKAMLSIEGSGALVTMDAIEHENKFWLVPDWLYNRATGTSKPVRMILLDIIPHARNQFDPHFLLHGPLPIALIEGRIPSGSISQYVVREAPDIEFRIPGHQD